MGVKRICGTFQEAAKERIFNKNLAE